MNKDYIKELRIIIEKAKQDIQNYYEENLDEDLEDKEVRKSIDKLLEQLEDTKKIINNNLISTNEGYLVFEDVSCNYVIKFLDGERFQPLTKEGYLDVYIKTKGWKRGKIGYNEAKGHYFYNPEVGYFKLYSNMKVRVR